MASLVAANAVFDYLVDLMGVQRAVGRFDYFRSAQDRLAFIEQMDAFFRSEGFELRERPI